MNMNELILNKKKQEYKIKILVDKSIIFGNQTLDLENNEEVTNSISEVLSNYKFKDKIDKNPKKITVFFYDNKGNEVDYDKRYSALIYNQIINWVKS